MLYLRSPPPSLIETLLRSLAKAQYIIIISCYADTPRHTQTHPPTHDRAVVGEQTNLLYAKVSIALETAFSLLDFFAMLLAATPLKIFIHA